MFDPCWRCGGSGVVSDGHPSDPASNEITCPECDTYDPTDFFDPRID